MSINFNYGENKVPLGAGGTTHRMICEMMAATDVEDLLDMAHVEELLVRAGMREKALGPGWYISNKKERRKWRSYCKRLMGFTTNITGKTRDGYAKRLAKEKKAFDRMYPPVPREAP